MSDPQDLLYTNKFISTDILTDNQLIRETEYYDRFKNYIDKDVTDGIDNYVKNNEYESSSINIDKTLHTKWPIYSNKNHYPLFDTYTNDISTNRYKKEVVTKINIDSRNRDLFKFNNCNKFSIQLDKVFNNVKKIVINDIIISNINQSITNINNNLSWQYVSQNYLIDNNIDFTIIPVPSSTTISYSSLPNAAYQYNTSSDQNINIGPYLVYQSIISPGFYSIDDLILRIRYATSKIVHGLNYLNNPDINIIEQPYLSYPERVGTPHLFSCSIDPITSIVRFVNRMDEIKISAIQTFSPYNTDFQNTDIFYYFSSQYSSSSNYSYSLNTSFIYIILPAISDITYQFYENINCIYTPNAFPLVITDLTVNIGNIDPQLINYTEFYDIQIYLQNGYTEDQLKSISYYKFIDTITFQNTIPGLGSNTSTFLRFALHLSTGNLNGNIYDNAGVTIRPSSTSNLVFSNGLNKILNTYNNINSLNTFNGSISLNQTTGGTNTLNGTYTNNVYTSGIITDYEYVRDECIIGRALLFRWIFDYQTNEYLSYEYDTENEKKRSLLHILGWPIANETKKIYSVIQSYGFKFVHTNYQSQIVNKSTITGYQTNSNFTGSNYPYYKLKLQNYSNKYYFVNNSYIYLKIYFDTIKNNEIDTQYLNSVSSEQLQYNQVYINSLLFNVGIGDDYTCLSDNQNLTLYKKDQSYIFTKILLSDIPGNTDIKLSNIINNNSFYIYYDNIKDKIDNINVELYDADMKLLFIDNNFSFTINIHEIKDILKETLINSKNNNVTTTGHFI